MPEEGPEPHEWVEKAADHQKEEDEGREPAHRALTMRAALLAAILAVLGAMGGLLSGHSVNDAILLQSEAILLQTKASDQWAYYQAKSTKQQVYEANQEIIAAIKGMAVEDETKFKARAKKYEEDKKEIEQEARKLESEAEEKQKESAWRFLKHQGYAMGIAAFQVGIVLASVTVMVRNLWSLWASMASGAVGILFLVRAFFT